MNEPENHEVENRAPQNGESQLLGLNQRQQSQTPILQASQIIEVQGEQDSAMKLEAEEKSEQQAKSAKTSWNAKNKKVKTTAYKSLVKSMLSEHEVQQELEAAAMLRKSEIENQEREVHIEEIEQKLFAD